MSTRSLSRRQFLLSASHAALASSVLSCATAPETEVRGKKSTPALRLSTSSIHFHGRPVEDARERIARLGFGAVDIWSGYQGCPHLDDVKKRLGARGLTHTLEACKLELFAFSVYVGGFPMYAKLLGESGGGVAVRGSEGPCDPEDLVPRMKAFLEGLKPQVALAEKNNTRLAIENHGHALLNSLDSLKAFVDLNESPHLGIALAPYHLQAAKPSVEEAIGICGEQLLFFYAWQRAAGVKQLPGHGPTDFKPWVEALAKAGYGGYLNIFMHGDLKPDAMEAALAKSRDYLTQCSGS